MQPVIPFCYNALRLHEAPVETFMIDQVRRYCRRWGLLSPGATLLVGVSGGADSLALLHLLSGWRHRLKLTLHAATLDHGLRGAAGAADAAFVEQYCQTIGVPCQRGYADVAAFAQENHLGVEAAARQVRYRFLAGAAQQVGADRIAVAHHADDQAETVLMHILRGTGLHGLGGMAPLAPLPGDESLLLIRPFLGITRQQIETYCTTHGLQACDDSTNADTALLRNRLRHQVLPDLETLNPQVRQALGQLADSARLDDLYLEWCLDQALRPILVLEKDRARVLRDGFLNLHPALARRAIMHLVRGLKADHELDFLHVTDVIELAQRGQQGGRVLLGDGLQARLAYDELLIERLDAVLLAVDSVLVPGGLDMALQRDHTYSLGDDLWLEVSAAPAVEADALRLNLPVSGAVRLRTRQQGDQVALRGVPLRHQKLSDWMINRKIPAEFRDRVPLVCINQQIVALYWQGWKVFAASVQGPDTAELVTLRFRKKI
jgi:tRNA(Ile)-lysidine synthase